MELSEIFPWNENFETGIPHIDEQHKMLVHLLNNLASHLAHQADTLVLNTVFNNLAQYAIFHFQTEEAVWSEFLTGDPWEQQHTAEHRKFVAEVLELKSKEGTKSLEQIIEDILSFLTHWLAFHILENDKRLALTVQEIQSGTPLDQAKINAEHRMTGSMKVLIETILSMYDTVSSRTLQLTREIIERQKVEAQLRLSAKIIENTMEQICITDPCARIIDFNPAFLQETEFFREEIVGKDLKSLKQGLNDPKVSGAVWQTVEESGHWSGEVLSRTKSGEIASEWLSLSEIKDEQGETSNYIAVFTNISHLASRQRQLERAAHYDVLTKLPNRLLLSDRLELAMAHADRNATMLAVCFMDLDGFKPVNDQYGHAAGDHVLVTTAHRVKSVLRANDTMARIGGDEFVLLLNNIKSHADCHELLDRLIIEVARPIEIDSASVNIGASIGVAFYPTASNSPEELVNLADQAMYTAKDLGKSRYHFHVEFVET